MSADAPLPCRSLLTPAPPSSSRCRYVSVLQQFEAVSFGDATFCSYVALPLTQRHSVRLRAAVWSEHSGVLQAMSVPLNQVPSLIIAQ